VDLGTIEQLFAESRDFEEEVWPDLDLLRSFVQLSSEGCIPRHFALHWHAASSADESDAVRYFPFPAKPGISYSAQIRGKVNEFCRLVWDDGRHLDPCILSNASAEEVVMKTRQPSVYDCHAGLTDIAVPVCSGETYLGTIFTGQVLRKPPSKQKFNLIRKKLRDLDYLDMEQLYRAYMQTPVVSEKDLRRTVETLVTVGEYVVHTWRKTDRLLEQERRLERMRGYQRKELVERLVSGQEQQQSALEEEMQDVGLEQLPTTVTVVRIDNLDTVAYGERQSRREILFERAVSKLQDVIEKVPNTVGAARSLGEIVILTRPSPTRNRFHRKLVVSEFGERVLDVLAQTSGLTGVAGVGSESNSLEGLRRSYREALEASLRKGADDNRRVVHIEDLSQQMRRGQSNGVFWQLQESLCGCLKRSEPREAAGVLREMTDWLRASGYATSAEQQPFMIDTMENVVATGVECGCDRTRLLTRKSQWLDELLGVSSPGELQDWMRRIIEHLFREVEVVRPDRMSKLVAKAQAFIERNSSRRLSLSEVADHVGLSPSYFRHRFREIAGVSFTEFQRKTKVRQACELLLDPEPTVTEVAVSLGYDSPSKFAKLFRQHVGVSPREYRSDPQKWRDAWV